MSSRHDPQGVPKVKVLVWMVWVEFGALIPSMANPIVCIYFNIFPSILVFMRPYDLLAASSSVADVPFSHFRANGKWGAG